jgi:microcystin-dependent protein
MLDFPDNPTTGQLFGPWRYDGAKWNRRPTGAIADAPRNGQNHTRRNAQWNVVEYPIGVMMDWPSTTIPARWLVCDGRSLVRTAYAGLFAVIGTTYGSASGTTFNLPDFGSRLAMGVDFIDGTVHADVVTYINARTIGNSGGNHDFHLHNHIVNDPTHGHNLYEPSHNHTFNDPGTHSHGIPQTPHDHGVGDPGHAHGHGSSHQHWYVTGAANGWGMRNLWQYPGLITHLWSGTGHHQITINGNGTGVGLHGGNANLWVDWGNCNGLWHSGSGTGRWVHGAGTAISVNYAGAGDSGDNTQPVMVMHKLIYAGV